jgi:hypothetical protein
VNKECVSREDIFQLNASAFLDALDFPDSEPRLTEGFERFAVGGGQNP